MTNSKPKYSTISLYTANRFIALSDTYGFGMPFIFGLVVDEIKPSDKVMGFVDLSEQDLTLSHCRDFDQIINGDYSKFLETEFNEDINIFKKKVTPGIIGMEFDSIIMKAQEYFEDRKFEITKNLLLKGNPKMALEFFQIMSDLSNIHVREFVSCSMFRYTASRVICKETQERLTKVAEHLKHTKERHKDLDVFLIPASYRKEVDEALPIFDAVIDEQKLDYKSLMNMSTRRRPLGEYSKKRMEKWLLTIIDAVIEKIDREAIKILGGSHE